MTFASIVAQGNVFATQFHPEKSSNIGLQIYRNFVAGLCASQSTTAPISAVARV